MKMLLYLVAAESFCKVIFIEIPCIQNCKAGVFLLINSSHLHIKHENLFYLPS